MKTSKRIVMAFCLSCFVAAPLRAQSTTEIELTRAEIQKARQAFVAEAIDLTEEEGLAFWPAYRDYRLDMARLGDRMVRLIDEFVKSSATLTVEQSNRLVDEYLDIRENEVAVRRKHVKEFRKILPAPKVLRFFQVENKLDAVVYYELAFRIPLAR